jgi:hypothetical protein
MIECDVEFLVAMYDSSVVYIKTTDRQKFAGDFIAMISDHEMDTGDVYEELSDHDGYLEIAIDNTVEDEYDEDDDGDEF